MQQHWVAHWIDWHEENQISLCKPEIVDITRPSTQLKQADSSDSSVRRLHVSANILLCSCLPQAQLVTTLQQMNKEKVLHCFTDLHKVISFQKKNYETTGKIFLATKQVLKYLSVTSTVMILIPYATVLFTFCCFHFSRAELEAAEYTYCSNKEKVKKKICTNRSIWVERTAEDTESAPW